MQTFPKEQVRPVVLKLLTLQGANPQVRSHTWIQTLVPQHAGIRALEPHATSTLCGEIRALGPHNASAWSCMPGLGPRASHCLHPAACARISAPGPQATSSQSCGGGGVEKGWWGNQGLTLSPHPEIGPQDPALPLLCPAPQSQDPHHPEHWIQHTGPQPARILMDGVPDDKGSVAASGPQAEG